MGVQLCSSFLARIESGDRIRMSAPRLVTLAVALGVTPDSLRATTASAGRRGGRHRQSANNAPRQRWTGSDLRLLPIHRWPCCRADGVAQLAGGVAQLRRRLQRPPGEPPRHHRGDPAEDADGQGQHVRARRAVLPGPHRDRVSSTQTASRTIAAAAATRPPDRFPARTATSWRTPYHPAEVPGQPFL